MKMRAMYIIGCSNGCGKTSNTDNSLIATLIEVRRLYVVTAVVRYDCLDLTGSQTRHSTSWQAGTRHSYLQIP